MKNIISFDEAGNTGQDLLNIDQKAFVLASVNFGSNDIEDIKQIFDGCGEIHFKSLKNSKKGREQIISFINHNTISEDSIICSVCDKEYLVIGQIIDQLVETVLYHQKI